jgi:hypothetical protein
MKRVEEHLMLRRLEAPQLSGRALNCLNSCEILVCSCVYFAEDAIGLS